MLQKSSRIVTGLTEVAGEAGESSVDAGRWLNEDKAISKWTMLSGKFQ